MRNVTTAISATVTAVVLGLLIANVASAARAADVQHAQQQQLAEADATHAASDTTAQLLAYRDRYAQSYQQVAVAYQALLGRDAAYRSALDRANAQSAALASANASLDSRLNEAYLALYDAQSVITSLRSAPSTPASAPDPRAAVVPRSPQAPQPTPTLSCRWDDGRYKCSDHEDRGHE